MTLLEQIQSGRRHKPPRILIYGTEGVGKSTYAAYAPKPIFLPTEDGLNEIACDSFPLMRSFDQVEQALQALEFEEHGYQTVVIDSLDWLEQLIWDDLCHKHNVSSIEKVGGGYAKGYIEALTYWRRVLNILQHLRDERSMCIILTAHSKVEAFSDPASTTYDRYSPRLHKHAAALVSEWVDCVLFATWRFRTQVEDIGFGRERTIAVGVGQDGGERILRTAGGPSCIAKNRYNLPYELPLNWNSFMEALQANIARQEPSANTVSQ